MNKKLRKEVSAVCVCFIRQPSIRNYKESSGQVLSVLASFPIFILSFSYTPFSKQKALVSLHQCFHVFMKDILLLDFLNPQYGPLLCLFQLVCLNWSSNVLRLSSCLYVFRLSKLTRIQIQMEEQQLCFLLLTSVLLCL